MNVKGEQLVATRDTWQPLAHDGDSKAPPAWMPYEVTTEIREAVVTGICDMFPGLPMDVCWDHLAAIAPADPVPLCKWCGGHRPKAAGPPPPPAPPPPRPPRTPTPPTDPAQPDPPPPT